MKKIEYLIHCPECKTTFDVSEQLEVWKEELFEKINKLVKKMKVKKK